MSNPALSAAIESAERGGMVTICRLDWVVADKGLRAISGVRTRLVGGDVLASGDVAGRPFRVLFQY